IKTHEAYLPLYHKAIYLVRDARDVALSEFAYQKALGLAEDNFETYLSRFLRGEVNPFGSWTAHVDSWMDAKDKGYADVLLVRFDEMRSQPEDSLANMMAFLNVPVQPETIRRAVANNSVEKMRDKEKVNPQKASAKGRFIRSGAVGGWRERFTDAQAELVEKYAGSVLARIGFVEVESLSR
ncbi:MAG: sulfotransferase domain-containing protein, partial [Candidatus Sulfotelmatobacter sp.]